MTINQPPIKDWNDWLDDNNEKPKVNISSINYKLEEDRIRMMPPTLAIEHIDAWVDAIDAEEVKSSLKITPDMKAFRNTLKEKKRSLGDIAPAKAA